MNKKPSMDPEKYAYLKAEAKAPYKGLRKFIYLAFGASAFIGGLIFFTQLIAGNNPQDILPNLALQIGILALMIFLWSLESKK
jgi:uncharacterized membrane protein YjgN (DUF898 family)